MNIGEQDSKHWGIILEGSLLMSGLPIEDHHMAVRPAYDLS